MAGAAPGDRRRARLPGNAAAVAGRVRRPDGHPQRADPAALNSGPVVAAGRRFQYPLLGRGSACHHNHRRAAAISAQVFPCRRSGWRGCGAGPSPPVGSELRLDAGPSLPASAWRHALAQGLPRHLAAATVGPVGPGPPSRPSRSGWATRRRDHLSVYAHVLEDQATTTSEVLGVERAHDVVSGMSSPGTRTTLRPR